jgi:hypothetical protein
MSFLARVVIVVLLSLSLPLQGSLAYARAVSMTGGQALGSAAVTKGISSLSAAAPEHAPHDEHHQHRNRTTGEPELTAKTADAHAAHQQSGNACDNCAKCCLAGAAAPPLIWPQAASIVAARVLFSPTPETPSCFIPDGPERPPRCL